MPRQVRIDAPAALHHVIIRGIERQAIFKDPADRANFVNRLARIISETRTVCYARVLVGSHFHFKCSDVSKAAGIDASTARWAVGLGSNCRRLQRFKNATG
jgi:hypothetical protein